MLGESITNLALWTMVVLTVFGTVFSIYLTFLEILAIHAICAWCLSSAVFMTLIMLVVAGAVTGGYGRSATRPQTRGVSA
jgi:uncharacterized membrane protein